jgi:hypothetical protein
MLPALPGGRLLRPLAALILAALFAALTLPLVADATASTGDDLDELGLVDEGEYASPQFGYEVTWSGDWDLDGFYDPPVISDEDEEVDELKLAWAGGDGGEAYVSVLGQSRGPAIDDVMEEWTDDDAIADDWGEGVTGSVALADAGRDSGAVLYALVETGEGDEPAPKHPDVWLSLFVVVDLGDDTQVYLTFSGLAEDFVAAYDEADEVLLDDEPVLVPFDAGDVADAVDAIEVPDAGEASMDELEDAGLQDEGAYESPQFGYAVTWTDAWSLDDYYAEPVVSDPEAGVDVVYLMWADDPTEDEIAYAVVSGEADGPTAGDLLAEWASDEHAASWGDHVSAEVILEDEDRDGGVLVYALYREDTERQYYKVYVAAELADGTVLTLTLSVHESDFEDAYAAAGELLVDGEPLLAPVDWDEIEAAMDEAA